MTAPDELAAIVAWTLRTGHLGTSSSPLCAGWYGGKGQSQHPYYDALSGGAGTVKGKKAPPGKLAGTHNRPPRSSMVEPQNPNPIPMPCALVVNSGLNIRSMALGSTPFPVSSTDTITLPESWTSDLKESTRSPSSVAMESIAFVIKFTSTCCS